MSRFEELLERLEADIATVHGRRLPVRWRFNPDAHVTMRWEVTIEEHPGSRPIRGHDGETPLTRLAEDYAARAHLIRERKGKR